MLGESDKTVTFLSTFLSSQSKSTSTHFENNANAVEFFNCLQRLKPAQSAHLMTVVSMNQPPTDAEYLTVYQRENSVRILNTDRAESKTDIHGTPAFYHHPASSFNNDSIEPSSEFNGES